MPTSGRTSPGGTCPRATPSSSTGSGGRWPVPVDPGSIVRPPGRLAFAHGDLVAAALGDVTGDGAPDLAASYRHPFRPSALSEA